MSKAVWGSSRPNQVHLSASWWGKSSSCLFRLLQFCQKLLHMWCFDSKEEYFNHDLGTTAVKTNIKAKEWQHSVMQKRFMLKIEHKERTEESSYQIQCLRMGEKLTVSAEICCKAGLICFILSVLTPLLVKIKHWNIKFCFQSCSYTPMQTQGRNLGMKTANRAVHWHIKLVDLSLNHRSESRHSFSSL